jgi:uncharacterized protein YoxC
MRGIGMALVGVWMAGWAVWAQTPSPPPASSVEALRKEVASREEELRALDQTYRSLLEKAQATRDPGERRRIMEEALRVSYRIQKLNEEYRKLWEELKEKSKVTEGPDPQADKLLAQIRELEARIQRMVEDINARIAKAEKESDPVLQERAKKQIQRMIDELNELKKRHQELAEQYRRLTEKAAQAAPPPPKEEKAKPPR